MPAMLAAQPHPTGAPPEASGKRPPLKSVSEAVTYLLDAVTPLAETESVSTFEARGRVLAEELTSGLDVPAFDNSQMDGYAVRAADLSAARPGAPVSLPVSQRIPAGHPAGPLAPGSAARIFTGAVIPDGADAIVMQEDAVADATAQTVAFERGPASGDWIRRRGEDITRGRVVLQPGMRLSPQHLGLAASIGAATLRVARRPRVALFSTGDELAMPGEVAVEDLPAGSLFNSNRYTLRALVEQLGCEVLDLGIVPDTLAATREALDAAAGGSDCIITSGGVSVGEEDHVRHAVAAAGHVDLWQIAIKPGKPFAFGRVRDAHFVGLPGNPVSGFVTFLMLVRPLLLRMQGVIDVAPRSLPMRADFEWVRPDKRQEYLRVRINPSGGLDLYPQQGSAVLTSTTWADGLVENPPATRIAPGDGVRYLPFAMLFAP